jgi:CRISPR-associated protein Csb2
MLAISVTLLHGTMRATSPDDRTLAGDDDPGDWPPSPARLVAALVAGDGTRDRCRVTTGAELALFELAAPPRIHASPPADVLKSPLNDRYVVVNERDDLTVQEYPARKAQLVRPGPRLSPKDPRVVYVWEDITASGDELHALRARAARVGYLGCADSPVRITVAPSFDPDKAPSAVWEPAARGDCDVAVPFPGFVDVLDTMFDRWTAGLPARRSWFRTQRHGYRSPGRLPQSERQPWEAVLWLRFDRAVPGRAALRVTEKLKAAVLDRYQRDVAERPGDVPRVLHGHGFDGESGYQLAQWIVLPDVGHDHAGGRLHGAAIMLPAGTEPTVVMGVRLAVRRLGQLEGVPGLEPVGIRLDGGEDRPKAANPNTWRHPSRRWASALPVVHERRMRHGPDFEEVARWCEHAGVPRPVQARISPLPLIPGGIVLSPHEVHRERPETRRPYSHLELIFDRPVSGPMVLGRARQFGMGLMKPVDDARARERMA